MAFKQSRRREDDIAIVNSCMYVKIDDNMKVKYCRLAFGGMAPKTIMAENTQAKMVDR